jgi:hypothetical protein
VITIMFFPVLLAEPNGIAARVLSWIPHRPMTMMLRLGRGDVPWWTFFRGGAPRGSVCRDPPDRRVFRGDPHVRKRPTIPEIWRWVREA